MPLTEYLDLIQNTEKETQLIEKLVKLKEPLMRASRVPFVGKVIKALAALADLQSVDAFKQSEYYQDISGYDIKIIDPETGGFSIGPGAEQKKKALLVVASIAIGIFLLWLCIRRFRKS
jgi:hypothetical protein